MGQVSFQVLDGLERGEVFRDLPTPVSIGREEDNSVRLNDERVSRFHAKVQEHNGEYILTDLDSTNGTRVNGHPVHLHVLRLGDQVLIGRCLLVFGSPEEIAAEITDRDATERSSPGGVAGHATLDGGEEIPDLFPGGPPPLPSGLNGIQTARMSDVVAYAHSNLLQALYSIQQRTESSASPAEVTISAQAWRRLQQLELELSKYLNQVAQPGGEE